MPPVISSLLLGILQGLTEFFPVSSSGHLALVLNLTGWEERRMLPLIVSLHLATTLAVLIYLRREVLAMFRGLIGRGDEARDGRRLVLLVIAATLPTAVIGLGFKDFLESLFGSPRFISAGLVITGLVLLAAQRATRGATAPRRLTFASALLIGLAQGVAIAPGISRSGATIGAGLLLGLARDASFTFSFLISIPANLGAVILEGRHLGSLAFGDILSVSVGMTAAFASGYLALALLSRWVRKGRLSAFSLYCWLLAAAIAVVL